MRPNRLLYLLMAFYLTFVGGASYYNIVFPVRVFHHVFITLILGVWLLSRLRLKSSRLGLPQTPLNVPLYGLIIIWLVNALVSIYPRMAFENLWFGAHHVVLFWIIVDLLMRGHQRMVMEIVFLIASVTVFITGLELASWYFGLGILPNTQHGWLATTGIVIPPLSQIPTVALAMSISTLLAGFVAPLVILSIGWSLTTHRRDYRVVLQILAVLLGIILILTRSRGGYLSVFVAIGAFALMQAMRSPRITRYISAQVLLGLGIISGLAVVIAFIALTFSRGEVGGSNAGRVDMWQSAIEMSADHPILGVGYGLFGRAFRDYRDANIAQDKLASAHNLALNTLAELGVVGTLAGMVLGGLVIRLGWRNWQSASSLGKKIRIEAVACALIGVGIHSMVDIFTITPIVLLLLVLLAYLITPLPTTRLVIVPVGQRLPALALLVLIGAYGLWFVQIDMAQSDYMASFSADSIESALEYTRNAQRQDPYLNLYVLHEAFLLGIGDNKNAVTAYEHALELEPTWDVGWANLAYLEEQSGNIAKAFTAIDKAHHINLHSGIGVKWARLAELNQYEPTRDIVGTYYGSIWDAFTAYRVLPTAPFWTETSLRQNALDLFVADVPIDWKYRILIAHDPQRANQVVPAMPTTARDWWILGEKSFQAGAFADAESAFSQAIALGNGMNELGDYYASRARAYVKLNNVAQARMDVASAQVYGTWFESPNLILASIAQTPAEAELLRQQALFTRAIPQEFAAVMYNRPALFDIPEAMQYPVTVP